MMLNATAATKTEALLALVLAADEYEVMYRMLATRGECEAIARREVIREFEIDEATLEAWEQEEIASRY